MPRMRKDDVARIVCAYAPKEPGEDMTKTHFGLCPSFADWTSRLPLFSDPIRRGRVFEVFREDGTPTGEPSQLGPDGWPVVDGRWHGVRLFGGMDGTIPFSETWVGLYGLRWNNDAAYISWRGGAPTELPNLKPAFKGWHMPSLEALAYFRPKVLRTLDWGYQSRKTRRPDWSKRRVLPSDPFQGEEMALELHCEAANLLKCMLWWNAPPRFELSVEEYETRLEEMLVVIRDQTNYPPMLQYGNELWNEGFPVHNWLTEPLVGRSLSWHTTAAEEISILKRVADSVFGEAGPLGQKPYYLFVDGHIGNPDTLDRILSALPFTPDAAGPAVYAQPLKVDQEKWKIYEPTQEAMRASVMDNMAGFRFKLDAHRNILKAHNVPFFACYEVGNDMHAKGEAYKKAALQAQREPWMGDVYLELRSMLQAAGVHLACWYSAASAQTMDRSFGLLETTLDKAEPLPKAKAARGE